LNRTVEQNNYGAKLVDEIQNCRHLQIPDWRRRHPARIPVKLDFHSKYRKDISRKISNVKLNINDVCNLI
jgi:hypothetical protein